MSCFRPRCATEHTLNNAVHVHFHYLFDLFMQLFQNLEDCLVDPVTRQIDKNNK